MISFSTCRSSLLAPLVATIAATAHAGYIEIDTIRIEAVAGSTTQVETPSFAFDTLWSSTATDGSEETWAGLEVVKPADAPNPREWHFNGWMQTVGSTPASMKIVVEGSFASFAGRVGGGMSSFDAPGGFLGGNYTLEVDGGIVAQGPGNVGFAPLDVAGKSFRMTIEAQGWNPVLQPGANPGDPMFYAAFYEEDDGATGPVPGAGGAAALLASTLARRRRRR